MRRYGARRFRAGSRRFDFVRLLGIDDFEVFHAPRNEAEARRKAALRSLLDGLAVLVFIESYWTYGGSSLWSMASMARLLSAAGRDAAHPGRK
jgi:hypothetical protein